MSFTSLRTQINSAVKPDSTHDYIYSYFNSEHQSKLTILDDKYIYHLYSDLIGTDIRTDFKPFLKEFYKTADEYAKDCVLTAFLTTHIHGMKIKNWTDSALKCFDCLLIRLISDVLKEQLNDKNIKERDVYDHLIKKGGNLYTIGMAFDIIYKERNKFTHVQIVDSDGVRRPQSYSNKKYKIAKDLILNQFNRGLNALILEIP